MPCSSEKIRVQGEIDSQFEILRSATPFSATIAVPHGMRGQIRAGFAADLIVLDGDPLKDLSSFERYRSKMPVVMRAGRFIRRGLH